MDETTAEVLAADATLTRRFRRADGTAVWLFIGYFAEQQVNSQIHSPRNCVPGGGWKVVATRDIGVQLSNGQTQPATLMRTRRNELSQDLYYWFATQGGTVSGEYALKWDLVKNSLARRPTNAAFVRYTAATADSAAVIEVMSLMDDPLDEMLAAVGL